MSFFFPVLGKRVQWGLWVEVATIEEVLVIVSEHKNEIYIILNSKLGLKLPMQCYWSSVHSTDKNISRKINVILKEKVLNKFDFRQRKGNWLVA